MNHATTCKFCKNPITIEIDDEYANLGDPYKLLQLACCNHCADLRVERERLERMIKWLCLLRHDNKKVAVSKLGEHRVLLQKLCQRYSRLIARWHGFEGMAWDDNCVEQLLERPEYWGDVLGRLWKMFKASHMLRVPKS